LQASLTNPPDADTPVVLAPGMAELPVTSGTPPASISLISTHPHAEGFQSAAAPGADSEPTQGPSPGSGNGMEDYERLQRRLLIATAYATALAVPFTAWLFDGSAALSLLIGGLGGLLYLRLLARSVSRLGGDRRSVGKIQLLVPVVLVMASARIPSLQIVPALVGFLLYKPALIAQALLDA